MLALKAFRAAFHTRLRPPNCISITNPVPHRLLSSSYKPPASPYTWPSKLWYRRDGSPRSKKEGAIYVTLALLTWLPFHIALDICSENRSILYLIHIRRINTSSPHFDLTNPNDMIEYIFKLCQMDFIPFGKEHEQVTKDICRHLLQMFPETCTFIRNQLEELRDLTVNEDIRQDTMETARTAEGLVVRSLHALLERSDYIQGLAYIKEGRGKSDSKDVYREVG